MKKRNHILKLLPIVFLFLLIGCATPEFIIQQQPEVKFSQFNEVYFVAESNVTEDVADAITEIETKVAESINKTKLFSLFQLGEPKEKKSNQLLIKATIAEFNEVSVGARILIGIFAGSDKITLDVSFIDFSTGKQIASLLGKEGSADISKTIEETANKIAEIITTNYK